MDSLRRAGRILKPMGLLEALGLGGGGWPNSGRATVVSLVGAGGKTTTMFGLAEEASRLGARVLVTTTTHIADPRAEKGRRFDRLVIDPGSRPLLQPLAGEVIVLGSGIEEASGKILGLAEGAIAALAPDFDIVLVEADGARARPIKAPAAHEPVIPASSHIVLGLLGLDALGAPATDKNVHRLSDFLRLVGLGEGEKIEPRHILSLLSSGSGLFKSAPPRARRVLVFTKADRASPSLLHDLLSTLDADGLRGFEFVLLERV